MPTVLTGGCFDSLHPGHAALLRHAAHLAGHDGHVVVAIDSDAQVRRNKGPDRPLFTHEHRRDLVFAVLADRIAHVDVAIFEDGGRPRWFEFEDLIRSYRPDILLKGAEYQGRDVRGRDIVESWGGRVEFAPMVPGHSTSALVRRIRAGREVGEMERMRMALSEVMDG